MGIDWYMCDVCGKCKVEYDFSCIDIINIEEFPQVCEECFDKLKEEKNIECVSEDDNEWKALKAFSIVEINYKSVHLLKKGKTKYDKYNKKHLEK